MYRTTVATPKPMRNASTADGSLKRDIIHTTTPAQLMHSAIAIRTKSCHGLAFTRNSRWVQTWRAWKIAVTATATGYAPIVDMLSPHPALCNAMATAAATDHE